jgi:hypothetical protein
MPPESVSRRLGGVCLTLALLSWAVALPLHCPGKAALVGGVALLAGVLLGAALAMVTRTRNPWRIYGWLAVAALTFWPMIVAWPPADPSDIHPWPHAPDIVANYFDILRIALFLVGIPYPFARFGQHAPDPRQDENSVPPEP